MVGQVIFDRYEVIRYLNQGSCGKIYLARRLDNGQEVVVKVLHDQQAQDPAVRTRFRQEMEFMARFRHPHAINLIEALPQSPFGPCIVMEYVNGVPLDQLLKQQKRIAPARVGRWLGQLGSALQHAHQLDIIHRDLKPSNLLVANPGTPQEVIKVADFGLSKVGVGPPAGQSGVRNPAERATGTPVYLSPEQARGEPAEPRSDLYSVGVMLYEMLTGKRPFFCATPKDYEQAHAFRVPPTFAQLSIQDVPPAIEDVVRRCLAKQAKDRPRDAAELVRLYEQALGERIDVDRVPETLANVSAMPAKPSQSPPSSGVLRKDGANTVTFHLEASMPARVAIVKLRGLLIGMGASCSEPEKDMLRAKLPRPAPAPTSQRKSGLFAGVGTGASAPPAIICLDARVTTPDAKRANQLAIALLFQSPDGNRGPLDAEGFSFCEKTCSSICACLNAKLVDV